MAPAPLRREVTTPRPSGAHGDDLGADRDSGLFGVRAPMSRPIGLMRRSLSSTRRTSLEQALPPRSWSAANPWRRGTLHASGASREWPERRLPVVGENANGVTGSEFRPTRSMYRSGHSARPRRPAGIESWSRKRAWDRRPSRRIEHLAHLNQGPVKSTAPNTMSRAGGAKTR